VPLSRGGGHTHENVQCACRKCNTGKNNVRVLGQLPLWANPQQINAYGGYR
jgi:5-methylcytosine-specific restriction endonuclease McrA